VWVVAHTFASRRSANRRRREEARQRILDAARQILQGKPFRDLTVDELMSATGLSRTAFYRYFPDREAVLLELLEEVWGELADARDAEAVGADFDDATSMARLTGLLAANQAVLKAITDAAPGDEDLDRAYRAFMHSYWIEDLTARIVEAQSHGLAAGLDPDLAGEALGWMVERMVTQSVSRDPRLVLERRAQPSDRSGGRERRPPRARSGIRQHPKRSFGPGAKLSWSRARFTERLNSRWLRTSSATE
jgi:TetR/AcrR family transcriptional regulator, ethionamide resistance regulator